VQAVLATDGRVVCDRCRLADRFFSRLRGLLGRGELPAGDGLLLSPGSSVHTFFMRFAIDVVFLDRDLRVVGVAPNLRPWRLAGRRGVRHVLELSAGEAERRGIGAGEQLALGDADATVRRTPGRARWALLAVLAVVILAVGGGVALAVPKAPVPTGPAPGAMVDGLPAFAWSAVAGAEEYEFQIAADSGFNSSVLGGGQDDFRTKNLRATLQLTVPNGTYWWRVRAIARTGRPSAWSSGRSFRKNWAPATQLLSPVGGTGVVYPRTPLALRWSPVAGARKYLVALATDPNLGSLVKLNGPGGMAETTATSFTPGIALAPGTYYWGVTPEDAENNKGVPSRVASFVWSWPSTTTLNVTDLASAPELFDPRFSWSPVAGAARYEVEINSSVDFAPGSKVCCTGTTLNTQISPTTVFKDNTYYWRVRAIDIDGNAGVWNNGPDFTKTFDNVPPVAGTSIKDVRLRDNTSDPGADTDVAPGYQTQVPVITWDPVPGAASYQVDVAPYTVSGCFWTAPPSMGHWTVTVATNYWAPIGTGWNGVKPYPDSQSVATDSAPFAAGKYCARIRARSDRASSQDVYGDYTYLDPDSLGWAFEWTGYPTGSPCSPSCTLAYQGSGDYLTPVTGTTAGQTPFFAWQPLAGAQSYFVIVAKDPSFTNIVDYAFTQLPVYAPRTSTGPTTYSDETTLYYWAVLPEAGSNGAGTAGDPLLAAPQSFEKRSVPPTKLSPAPAHVFLDEPSFQWTPVVGARTYRLQVAQDPSFGTLLDDVTTDSTAYSSNTTYPADTVLYWRVRANDENNVGLTWSTTGTFQKRLASPAGSGNATIGDFIPTWAWNPVHGAVSYDLSADLPNGTHRDATGLRSPAVTPTLMYGTGIFHWRVRAEFPRSSAGLIPGPYSSLYSFARTIKEPTGAQAQYGRDWILLRWNAKPGARAYRVQISGTPDFATPLQNVVTDNTAYAPTLEYRGQLGVDPGRLYWRVAAMDEGNNLGDFTQPQLITRIRRMEVAIQGTLRRGRSSSVTIQVSNFETGSGVPRARLTIVGAGIRRKATVSVSGYLRVTLRPRRGRLVVRATHRGYSPTSTTYAVR
jgi:uncharacterized membrane protein (UPF0127 family)